jgi:transposase-like protein
MVIVKVPCMGEVVIVLVELGLVEQRYQAVLEVVNQGVSVTEVAVTFRVTRQTVHRWLRRYAARGLGGLVDGSARPLSWPHQMTVAVEARIVELRRAPPVGAAHDPVSVGGGADDDVAGSVADLSVSGASVDLRVPSNRAADDHAGSGRSASVAALRRPS